MSLTDLRHERERNARLVVSLSDANKRIAELEAEIERLERALHGKQGECDELDNAFGELETKIAALEATLGRIAGMCGAPDPGDACRNILAIIKETK